MMTDTPTSVQGGQTEHIMIFIVIPRKPRDFHRTDFCVMDKFLHGGRKGLLL
jgi:hypothetical protein